MVRSARRGAVDVQLNWVFILIAGTVILTFFFAVIQKQKSYSESKVAQSLQTGFEGIFTGALSSSDTVFTMDIPRGGVSFHCDPTCDCRFGVGEEGTQFQDKMLFAKQHLEGPEITLWAYDFELPYMVTTFLYITSPHVQYVFVTDDATGGLARSVIQDWPANLSVSVVSPAQISSVMNNNYAFTTFVFFDEPSNALLHESFFGKEANGVKITQTPSGMYEAVYYTKYTQGRALQTEPGTLFIPNKAALLGAIFADDSSMYHCNMKETYKRFASISSVYAGRAQKLGLSQDVTCTYGDAVDIFEKLATWGQEGSITGSRHHEGDIPGQLTALEEANNHYLRQSCPLVY